MNIYISLIILCILSGCENPSPAGGSSSSSHSLSNTCLEKVLKFQEKPLKDKKDFWKRIERPYEKCLNSKDNIVYMNNLSNENIEFFKNWNKKGESK